MVSDIYFPIPPTPFYPALPYPSYQPSQHRSSHVFHKPSNHAQFDVNKNQIPYYYSETLAPSSPNNAYGFTNAFLSQRNRFISSGNHLDMHLNNHRNINQSKSVRSRSQDIQYARPVSVLERRTKSPIAVNQRPSSVVPITDQFRPASAYFRLPKREKISEMPEWKSKLILNSTPPQITTESRVVKEKSLKLQCRIPNCKCQQRPNVDFVRFATKTLPVTSDRSLNKMKNLSLPSLKFDLDGEQNNFDKIEAERDIEHKNVAEHNLGYV